MAGPTPGNLPSISLAIFCCKVCSVHRFSPTKLRKTGKPLRDQMRHLAVASLDSRKAVELTLHLVASLLLFSEHSRHCNPAAGASRLEAKSKVIKLSVGFFIATSVLSSLLVVILYIAVVLSREFDLIIYKSIYFLCTLTHLFSHLTNRIASETIDRSHLNKTGDYLVTQKYPLILMKKAF